MKSLSITLLAALFFATAFGINPEVNQVTKSPKETTISKDTDIQYSFEVNRHIKKGVKVPTHA
ncbi:hypothetical protein OS188_03295 [Xanthomarina sp. F1114]|uniref:hypothetical protein n=1 Tax=Xanthomarina sp. F1114 TaxID=2996019 RepID=UPI00225DEC65|nr:hypothetical protein [Xanthomarina sp. F1114]MCX7546972.1 hypothetical protein [Xanthomarina sp. F1114]